MMPAKYFGRAHLVEFERWSEDQGARVYTATGLPDFRDAVFSWNVGLEENAGVGLWFAVRASGTWSEPFLLARWSAGPERGSVPIQETAAGTLDVDVFTAAPGQALDGIRVWMRPTGAGGFQVDALYASLRRRPPGDAPGEFAIAGPSRVAVPPLVQFPIADIGARICSPTACAMLLAALGQEVDVRALADAAWDGGADIYGNWSMNMAATARPGIRAYVRHFEHIGQLADRAAAGRATAISVRTSADTGFTGALQTYPGGHLLVVTGFEPEADGTWSVHVNDPADHETATAARRYPLAQVEAYWNGIGYVVEPASSSRDQG